jgi:hypothetical protein
MNTFPMQFSIKRWTKGWKVINKSGHKFCLKLFPESRSAWNPLRGEVGSGWVHKQAYIFRPNLLTSQEDKCVGYITSYNSSSKPGKTKAACPCMTLTNKRGLAKR